MSYLSAVKLTRALFWTTLVAGILALLFPRVISIWLPVSLGIGCGLSFLLVVRHVTSTRRREFRCPKCGWIPFALPAWKCKKCGHVWDSFSTHGVCPECGHRHDDTVCVRCRQASANADWDQ